MWHTPAHTEPGLTELDEEFAVTFALVGGQGEDARNVVVLARVFLLRGCTRNILVSSPREPTTQTALWPLHLSQLTNVNTNAVDAVDGS